MNRFPSLRALLTAGVAAVALQATPALATNGYFSHGYSTQSKGMAGTGVTLAEGAMGLAQNPALGVAIGNSAEFDVTLFMPFRSATFGTDGGVVNPGTYESDKNLFLIPGMGVNYMVTPEMSLGVVMYGNGGMNTSYDAALFANFGAGSAPTGVDMAQMFIAFNLSRKVADNFTIGLAPVLAVQYFDAYGLQAFSGMSSSPNEVSNNGYDLSYGGGFRFGMVWDALPWLSVGATYQTRMLMTPFEEYRGLFAEQGDFDIPPTAQIGLNLKPMKGLNVLLEYQRIWYGDVDSISNSGTTMNALGLDNGMGFGWQDMDIFRIGVEYQVNEQLKVRTGFSHATDFTTSDEILFNTLAPATINNHISVGATYQFNPAWAISFAYTYAFQAELDGNPMMLFRQSETIEMDQHEVSLGVTYKF